MTIVCGTDFTPHAGEAARAAARLAAARRTDLLLVHVFELAGAENVLLQSSSAPAGPLRAYLEAEAGRLRKQLDGEAQRLAQCGAPVKVELLGGTADESVVHRAERAGAELIAVGALGRRSADLWGLGSHADRIAQVSKCPVLIVRDAAPFDAWLEKKRPLRVLVAVDSSSSCDVALAWTARIAALAPCDVIAAHVYWPPEHASSKPAGNAKRAASIPIGAGHADVEAALATALAPRLAQLAGVRAELRLVGGLGRPADHLVEIVRDEKIDLAVVGNHQRSGLSRLWNGSVSRGVVDLSPSNVACVPTTAKP